MRREWTAMSAMLWACASGQMVQPQAAHPAVPEVAVAAAEPKSESVEKGAPLAKANAKTFVADAPSCAPSGEPKVVTGESSVSDSADTGAALIFEMAGVALEFPACTPGADVRVITTSWETKDRPNPSRIHPNFSRHAATIRVDHVIEARESAPLLVRLHSKRELIKPGEKLVLAVESSGECDAQHARDQLDDGGCAHWQLFDTHYDASHSEMVASIPATGGHRLQFGWVPTK